MNLADIDFFYNTDLGKAIQPVIADKIAPADGKRLWLGYGKGYMEKEDRCFYPFGEEAFNKDIFRSIAMVHTLELSDNPSRLLLDAWDCLEGEGTIHIIVPNRAGFWARRDKTPFGEGQPFSHAQITRLINEAGFRVKEIEPFLYTMPSHKKIWLKIAPLMERVMPFIFAPLGGMLYIRATKHTPAYKVDKNRTEIFATRALPA